MRFYTFLYQVYSISANLIYALPMAGASKGRREQKRSEHRKLRRASKRVVRGVRAGTTERQSGQPLTRDLRRLAPVAEGV
jgi:hypothetical protein